MANTKSDREYTESEMHSIHAPVEEFAYPFAYYNSGDPDDLCVHVFTCEDAVRRELIERGKGWPVMAITDTYIVLRSVDCENFDDIESLERSLDGYDRDDNDCVYSHLFLVLDQLYKARGQMGGGAL